jgi:type IV secretory pathway TrbD component
MAASTGIVVAAGSIALLDTVLGEWRADRAVMVAAGTTAAALVAAALDKTVPGFGTGLSVVLLVSVLYAYAPAIAHNLNRKAA